MKTMPPEIHCPFSHLYSIGNFKRLMKLSWTSLKISIAGAKLSHLVQKDKIWDHGSMTEQARIIFYLVQKAKSNRNFESLRKHCTESCFERLKLKGEQEDWEYQNDQRSFLIRELAVMSVRTGKNNKPDRFTAWIKGISLDSSAGGPGKEKKFEMEWDFERQGEWWMLDGIHNKKSVFIIK